MRSLLTLVVVGVLAGAAYYYWQYRPTDVQGAREALGSVRDKLYATKTATTVKAALKLDRELANQPIDVDAGEQDGVVILSGEVPSADVRAAAERRAAAVPDVRQVVNELRVNPDLPPAEETGRTLGESFDDRALEAKVRMALSLNRELKGTDIDVRSYRRQVTLRGQVDALAQRQLAVEIARRTGDVAGVTDEIGVRGAAPASPAAPPAAAPTVRPGAGKRPEAVPNASVLVTL